MDCVTHNLGRAQQTTYTYTLFFKVLDPAHCTLGPCAPDRLRKDDVFSLLGLEQRIMGPFATDLQGSNDTFMF
jgi:hypothetical protein